MVNPYDRVRYPGQPFALTHPTATGALAALFGRRYTPFGASRILEIGCGEGVNLLNMALGAPKAEFVGVDLAEAPIAIARAVAKGCGCANVRFHVCDLADLGAGFGSFDYVIAHGLYAWIPREARQALMRVASERLAADGLALVSYNALPGSRFRQAIRDILLTVTEGVEDPAAKLTLARTFLAEQIEVWADSEADEYAMKNEARRILMRPPEVLFHDELGDEYAPELLGGAVACAVRHGLGYMCDAEPRLSEEAFFPSDAFATTRQRSGGDWARFEQLADLRAMRAFRHSIFFRGGSADPKPDPARLKGLWACGELTVAQPDPAAPGGAAFEAPGGVKFTTNDPNLVEFLTALAAAFPLALPLDDASANPRLANHVFRLFFRQAILLATTQAPLVLVPGDRPRVSALARVQAANGESKLVTLRHNMILIEEASVRSLIPLIDGTRARADLAREIAQRDEASAEEAAARLDEILAKFARFGLLAG